MASKSSKIPLALVFIFSLLAMGALVAAAATAHWVGAIALRENLTSSEPPQVPDENGLIPAFTGYIQFGLFNGQKIFNPAYSQRPAISFSIFEEHKDVYSIAYPIATIISVVIAAIFALVSAIFGLVNTLTVPIETIHGPIGLFVWNGIGAVCSLAAWILYLVLLLTQLTKNVLNAEDMVTPFNFVTHSAFFQYSYWLVVASCGLFLVNLLCIFLARLLADPDFIQQRKRKHDLRGENNTGLDDIIMY